MSGPASLFAPHEKSSSGIQSDAAGPPDSPPVETSHPLRTRPKKNSSRRLLHVSMPVFSAAEKAIYQPFSQDPIPSDDEFPGTSFHSIIGEYQEGPELFYFAKTSEQAQAFKVPFKRMRAKQPSLVEQYTQRKGVGVIDPTLFDPRADYIQPSSRVRMKLSLPAGRMGSSVNKYNSPVTDDSYASHSSDDELEDEGYSDPTPKLRRSTRQIVGPRHQEFFGSLPFSPKKTRSGARRYSSEEDTATISSRLRRSTHSRRGQQDAFNRDGRTEENQTSSPRKVPRKRKSGDPNARPAYGHVRGIGALDYDSDEDTQPLRSHRSVCEKCHRQPTDKLLMAAGKGKRKRVKKCDDDDESDDQQKLSILGGWVQCLNCPVSAHWGCLARTQRDEILRAILERERAEWKIKQDTLVAEGEESSATVTAPAPIRRSGLDSDFVTEFVCGSCVKGGVCMTCQEIVLEADSRTGTIDLSQGPSAESVVLPDAPAQRNDTSDVVMKDEPAAEVGQANAELPSPPKELLFRCFTCKRLAHYAHLPIPDVDDEFDSLSLAVYYQSVTKWQCADCNSFVYDVDQVIAWRPFPAQAMEHVSTKNIPLEYKLPLPRQYLVKWQGRSYRRLQWVPHMWLLATNPTKLKNFLAGSRPFELLSEPVAEDVVDSPMPVDPADLLANSRENGDRVNSPYTHLDLGAPVWDAEQRIPPAWKSVDRVLDVLLWRPQKLYHRLQDKQRKGKAKKLVRRANTEDDELEGTDKELADRDYDALFTDGEQPRNDLVETVKEFELRTGRNIHSGDAERVVWAFVKWNDLGYDAATWDTPPKRGDTNYPLFQRAFDRFVLSREIVVPVRSLTDVDKVLARGKKPCPSELTFSESSQPQLGQADGLKLMPFQVAGVNWLCSNWWKLQHCILADEMGLGKTVQIVTFLGVVSGRGAFPALVVVPNSTITNWVREFERWAPHLRVCSFYGEAKSRDIIKQYELWHPERAPKTTGAKYNVLVTTFETITNNKEFGPVFKQTPRWEVLVVDEGQRLKSDTSLIFRRLGELTTTHRIILTGTPLNNNIRELFNLMNFLDSQQWRDLEALSREYEELTEDRIKELHIRLRPYFLRRVKAEVLQLPPKNEVIVPVSMAPLQKEIYRSILSQNAVLLKSLSQGLGAARVNAVAKHAKTNMNNILMELRKCLQHPYLVSRDIEPAGLSSTNAHEKLIDASAKLRLLKILLPKLKARGHRVLLFSQFSIGLNILEDFLIGEQMKYLRLDGNTKQAHRQKDMDEFNKPNSDIFVYLLTTRAGGVGINLWTADTVIIFDPDFNPHQDLQAIARAHRFGQKKTCLVFKLMVKDSAEERIMQTGKKKLVLDHLIVQKMEDSDSKEDVQSILMFGAQTLFQDNETQNSRDISYTDHDIDTLIEKTEREGEQQEEHGKEGSLFSFAKIWAADKDTLEEIGDEVDNTEQADSWAQTLQLLGDEMAKDREQEATGRGVRRRAAAVFPAQQRLDQGDIPIEKDKKKKRKNIRSNPTVDEDSDAYAASVHASDDDSISSPSVVDDDFVPLSVPLQKGKHVHLNGIPNATPLSSILNTPNLPQPPPRKGKARACGLCGTVHSDGACFMTESAENLAEFRNILLSHAGDETIEERRAAIAIIDETLYKRGRLHLIFGQPLHLVETPPVADLPPPHPRQLRVPQPINNGPASGSFSMQVNTRAPVAHSVNASRPSGYYGTAKSRPSSSKYALVEPDDFGHSLKKGNKQHVSTLTTPLRPPPLNLSGSTTGPHGLRVVTTPITSLATIPRPNTQPTTFRVSLEPSKRPSSPLLAPSPPKKMKVLPHCPICSGAYHLAKDCPLVRKGSQSIQQEIKRLQAEPVNEPVVQVLRSLLGKCQAREQLAASASGYGGGGGGIGTSPTTINK